jgi:hypothetical protein
LSAMGRSLLVLLGLLAWGTPASRAEDLERGKSGPAIFAADCAACHRSAQGLAYGINPPELMDLLRQHYTTGPGPANQVATYLLSVVGNGRRPKEKPLTEPPGSGPAGDQANKRRREETEPVGPRPPGEIRGNEAAVGEPRGAAGDRAGGRASNRSKKPGQPATAARGSEYEPARPPEQIPPPPSDAGVAPPAEPADARAPTSREAKPAETAPRAQGAKPEAPPESAQVRTAAPGESRKPPTRSEAGDQPAFSAPSP